MRGNSISCTSTMCQAFVISFSSLSNQMSRKGRDPCPQQCQGNSPHPCCPASIDEFTLSHLPKVPSLSFTLLCLNSTLSSLAYMFCNPLLGFSPFQSGSNLSPSWLPKLFFSNVNRVILVPCLNSLCDFPLSSAQECNGSSW